MKKSKYYYDVRDDLAKGCWLNFIVGGRNTGKTYSTLRMCKEDKKVFAFTKRTNDDVKILCEGAGVGDMSISFSPFNSLNRDFGWNVQPKQISKGIGGFWDQGEDGPEGFPIGYILSLNALRNIKGFEFPRMLNPLIFDEFIPQPWEKVNRNEGKQVMDLYKTLDRDRIHRGEDPLQLIMLANAVRLSNPIFNFFEVTDEFADMQAKGEELRILEDRGILLHLLKNSEEFDEKEHSSIVYRAMYDTDWGAMAYGNNFAYDDISTVGKRSMKGFRPVVSVQYKKRTFYIYMKEGFYYMTTSRNDQAKIYNLNRENEQKAFFKEWLFELREACIYDKMIFETYTMYDLIINYKKIFQI